MIGITDEPFDGPDPDVPRVEAEEEAFLLTSIGRVLERPPLPDDVVGRYAGLRPLLADGDATAPTADLSRRHAVVEHDGVVTVVGGKLTTARRMAQDARRPGRAHDAGATDARRASRTASALCAGADSRTRGSGRRPGALGDRPASRAQLRFAIAHELALTPADLLDRRSRIGLVPTWREAALDAAQERCWTG